MTTQVYTKVISEYLEQTRVQKQVRISIVLDRWCQYKNIHNNSSQKEGGAIDRLFRWFTTRYQNKVLSEWIAENKFCTRGSIWTPWQHVLSISVDKQIVDPLFDFLVVFESMSIYPYTLLSSSLNSSSTRSLLGHSNDQAELQAARVMYKPGADQ